MSDLLRADCDSFMCYTRLAKSKKRGADDNELNSLFRGAVDVEVGAIMVQ